MLPACAEVKQNRALMSLRSWFSRDTPAMILCTALDADCTPSHIWNNQRRGRFRLCWSRVYRAFSFPVTPSSHSSTHRTCFCQCGVAQALRLLRWVAAACCMRRARSKLWLLRQRNYGHRDPPFLPGRIGTYLPAARTRSIRGPKLVASVALLLFAFWSANAPFVLLLSAVFH